jgi:hypothetical protein
MSILGFQVVLLDEAGQELERIPDIYEGQSHFVRDAYGYVHLSERETYDKDGQRVRYFQRVKRP